MFVYHFGGSYALALKLKVTGYKHFIWWLTAHDMYNKMFLISRLVEFQKQYLVLKPKPILKFEKIFSKYIKSCLFIIFSKIFETASNVLTDSYLLGFWICFWIWKWWRSVKRRWKLWGTYWPIKLSIIKFWKIISILFWNFHR